MPHSSILVYIFLAVEFCLLPSAIATEGKTPAGHVYSFSFAKAKPDKANKTKNRVVKPSLAPDKPLAEPLDPVAPTVTTAMPVPVSTVLQPPARIETLPEKPLWTLAISAAEIIDRDGRQTRPLLGLGYNLWRALHLDAQVWGRTSLEASLGGALRQVLPGPSQRIAVGLLAGVLTTPGETNSSGHTSPNLTRLYYGIEAAIRATQRASIVGQVRLQDENRYGMVNLGLAYRL